MVRKLLIAHLRLVSDTVPPRVKAISKFYPTIGNAPKVAFLYFSIILIYTYFV